MSVQPSSAMKTLIRQRVKELPGPQGAAENEPYMTGLVGHCDALAMFNGDGSVMWAWSQDQMNGWYWHCDLEQDAYMYSTQGYTYTQGDGSELTITDETSYVKNFIAGNSNVLFFNGFKFHLTQKDTTDDGITWVVMGGSEGRGLHCSISPGQDCMVVAAASTKALPTETVMGVDCGRKPGAITIDSRQLAGMFRAFAPGALGV